MLLSTSKGEGEATYRCLGIVQNMTRDEVNSVVRLIQLCVWELEQLTDRLGSA